MTTETNPNSGTPASTANVDATGAPAAGAEGGTGAEGTGTQGPPDPAGSTPDASGAGDTPPVGDTPPGDTPPGDTPPATPAGGEVEFTVPEGIVLTPEWKSEIQTMTTELEGLDPAARGQKLVDMGVKFQLQLAANQQAEIAQRIEQWAVDSKADPEIGGANYDANVQIALEAVGKFGDADLTRVFNELGLGNHPAFIRAFTRIGKATREASGVHGVGNSQAAAPQSTEQRLAAQMFNKPAK